MTPAVTLHDDTRCALGEGPLWHPERATLYWFDILGDCLLAREDGTLRRWEIGERASAAGWIDADTLLVATESALRRLDLATGALETVVPLDALNPATRSNDGRADPHGGFWIGTMGKAAEPGLGAIHRYYRGELRTLFAPIDIPNAICFDHDGGHAYFTDTHTMLIRRVALDGNGWPSAEPAVWLDLRGEGWKPDGAVIDAEGAMWNAQWGGARIARYGADAAFLCAVEVTATQATCPAFGGEDFTTMFCTSADDGAPDYPAHTDPDGAGRSHDPRRDHGRTFAIDGAGRGVAEYRVVL